MNQKIATCSSDIRTDNDKGRFVLAELLYSPVCGMMAGESVSEIKEAHSLTLSDSDRESLSCESNAARQVCTHAPRMRVLIPRHAYIYITRFGKESERERERESIAFAVNEFKCIQRARLTLDMATLKYATVPISPKRGKILPVAADRDSHSRIGVPPILPLHPPPSSQSRLWPLAFYASAASIIVA